MVNCLFIKETESRCYGWWNIGFSRLGITWAVLNVAPIGYLTYHGVSWTQHVANVKAEYEGLFNAEAQQKEEDDMLEKAIVINRFADFGLAEPLAASLMVPIYTRAAFPAGKVAKEVYVVGGSLSGIKGDKVVPLTGVDRYEVAAAVKHFLKRIKPLACSRIGAFFLENKKTG